MAMKYKLTTNTKIHFGIKLFQIEAIVSFGDIKKGEVGGWVEREDNLSHDGDAWVSGDAARQPIHIEGLAYQVTITDQHIKIGCELHEITEWDGFSNNRILEMDGKAALKFWKAHKKQILGLAKSTGRPFKAEEKQ